MAAPNLTTTRPSSLIEGPALADEPGLGLLTLPGYLGQIADRFADREALVAHQRDGSVTRWTYLALQAHSFAVAKALIAGGLAKNGRVAVLMSNRPEWLASVFGVTLAGGVAVPLSTFSTPSELAHLLQVSCASTVLLEGRVLKKDFVAILLAIVPALGRGQAPPLSDPLFPYLRRLVVVGDAPSPGFERWESFLADGAQVSDAMVQACAGSVTPADPALLFFSSGSTGKPKGIVNSHRAVAIQCWRWPRLLGLDRDVRCWCANGFFWSGSFGQAAAATLSAGGSLVLQPTFDAEEALRLFEAERVTTVVAWPHQYAQFAEAPSWDTVDLSSLRHVSRGSTLADHPSVDSDWDEPTAAYGATETFTLNAAFPSGTPRDLANGSHGVPLPGNSLKILDPATGETLPRGEPGEIAVKGPTLMMGYLGVPLDETLDDQGFFHTGDGGYVDDAGRLIWEGRLNDIIKTGGANVSPIEIDTALIGCDGVKMSQTVGVPDDKLGEIIVTCVVAVEGREPKETVIREWLRARIASYKVPRVVLFVTQEDLSFTGSAKIRTAALRDFVIRGLETRLT
ncbi:class I adenylate-forming enzyme family protein [Caulobacter sp. LARHSG274]